MRSTWSPREAESDAEAEGTTGVWMTEQAPNFKTRVVCFGAASLIGVAVFVGLSHTISATDLAIQRGGGVAPSGRGPLAFGKKATLRHVNSQLAFRPALPRVGTANAPTAGQMWVDSKNNQFAVSLNGGAITEMEWPNQNTLPTDQVFSSFLNSTTGQASVTSVQGYPALAIQQNSDLGKNNPAYLEIDTPKLVITLYSESVSIDDLVAMAQTLQIS